MRIAVTYENGRVFQHFGHTSEFKLYDVEDGGVVASEILSTDGSGCGALAGFLVSNNVDVVICGGIGEGAQNSLKNAGLRLYGGVNGDADAVVQAFLANSLEFDPQARCVGHEEGHSCGGHEHGDGGRGCRRC